MHSPFISGGSLSAKIEDGTVPQKNRMLSGHLGFGLNHVKFHVRIFPGKSAEIIRLIKPNLAASRNKIHQRFRAPAFQVDPLRPAGLHRIQHPDKNQYRTVAPGTRPVGGAADIAHHLCQRIQFILRRLAPFRRRTEESPVTAEIKIDPVDLILAKYLLNQFLHHLPDFASAIVDTAPEAVRRAFSGSAEEIVRMLSFEWRKEIFAPLKRIMAVIHAH